VDFEPRNPGEDGPSNPQLEEDDPSTGDVRTLVVSSLRAPGDRVGLAKPPRSSRRRVPPDPPSTTAKKTGDKGRPAGRPSLSRRKFVI